MIEILKIVFLVTDILLFVISGYLFFKGIYKLKKYGTTIGEIIDIKIIHSSLDDVGVDTIFPTIKYNINEIEYKTNGKYCSPNSKIGDKIELLYKKDNPKIVSAKKGLFIAPSIVGSIAIVLFIVLMILFML